MRLGFLGVGTLVEAVVEGLATVHGAVHPVLLSPRSEARSQALAQRHVHVCRVDSNQAVVDGADVVFLGMRPQDMATALDGLRFRADHIVVSFVAGAGLPALAQVVAPASRLCRVTPLPPIARRDGPILIFPDLPEIAALFEGLGDVIRPATAEEVFTLGYAGGLMSSFFAMAAIVVDWLEAQGSPRDRAERYVYAMYAALGRTGLNAEAETRALLVAAHETPGGLNARCRAHLAAQGWFEALAGGLDAMGAAPLLPEGQSAPPPSARTAANRSGSA